MFVHQLISDMNDVIDIVAEKRNLLAFDEKTLDTVGADKVSLLQTTTCSYFFSLVTSSIISVPVLDEFLITAA